MIDIRGKGLVNHDDVANEGQSEVVDSKGTSWIVSRRWIVWPHLHGVDRRFSRMSEGAERATDGWIGNFLDVLVMTPVAVVGAVYVFLPFVLFALELVALPLLVILAAGRPFVEARSQDGRTVSIIRRSGSPGATDSRLMTRLEAADGSLS